jgi:hypothetical protein
VGEGAEGEDLPVDRAGWRWRSRCWAGTLFPRADNWKTIFCRRGSPSCGLEFSLFALILRFVRSD